MENCVREMMAALEANIEYLQQEGSAQLNIKNGKFLHTIGDTCIYEFILDFFQNIEPDTDVEVRVRSEFSTGKVIAVNEKNIQIALDRNIGVTIPAARLIISSYYLLQLLYEKLKKVDTGELRLTDFAEKLFGLKQASISSLDNYEIPHSFELPEPNPSQEDAIRLALGSEISFIWGPPGTGKTETIARIIEGFLFQNLSVLLNAHTNIATDGALLKVVKLFRSSPYYLEGKILREGKVQNSELETKYEMVIPSVVLDKKGLPIKKEIESLNKTIHETLLTTAKSEEILRKFRKIETLRKEQINIEGDIAQKEVLIANAKMMLEVNENQLIAIDNKITKCQSLGSIRRFLSGLNMEKLMIEKSTMLVGKERETQNICVNSRATAAGKEKLNRLYIERKGIEEQLCGQDRDHHEKLIEKARIKLKDLKEQRDLLLKYLEGLADTLIKEAKVVATTLTKSYSSQIVLNREYDCVIVDEASMAPLPALWCAAGLAKKKVVIVGDFYQLPPIAKHKVLRRKEKPEEEVRIEETLVEKWLKRDIFEVSGITASIHSNIPPDCLRQLKIQYRMHPDIAGIVNVLIYGKQFELESGDNTLEKGNDRIESLPLPGAHVGVYDTSKMGAVSNRTDSGSYYNLYHAFLTVALTKQAIANGYESIGIISPFRPQANLISKIIEDEGLGNRVVANTVHRFQGEEKQIIIFDTTTAQPTKLTDDKREGGDDEKLLNVAFSRAEEKCIIIADIDGIRKRHSLSSLLGKFVEHCYNNNFPILSSEDILPKYSVSESTEKWLLQINNAAKVEEEVEKSRLFDETDFYQYFIKDLLAAQQEVIIDSPYITHERARTFAPIFNHLINKGIGVFILTRQPKNHDSNMQFQSQVEIKNYEDMGIIVLPFFGQIHRKLAIIDRDILWEGSLNILSQRDSHEIMRRFAGIETARQMMTFLKLDKNIGGLGENKLQHCEYCKEPGAWYWTDKSIYGYWTFCLIGGHKLGSIPKTKEELNNLKMQVRKLRKSEKEVTNDGVPICPKHDLPMIQREGPFGKFWGCPKYPVCKITHKMK